MIFRSNASVRQLDRRRARVAARAIAERRRHARVGLALEARMLHADRRETGCSVLDIGAGGLSAQSPLAPRINSRVVVHADKLGRLEGVVVRVSGGRFSLRFDAMTERKRVRLADALAWEINRGPLGLEDDRRSRRRGKTGAARIVLSDGVETRGDYIDVSDTGASFAANARPRRGESARVEDRPARIARLHDRGFAVDFVSEAKAEEPPPAPANDG